MMRVVFGGLRLMSVIELVSKWEICWVFVVPSCVLIRIIT